MEYPRDELERLMQYEKTRMDALAEYRRDPTNVDNLTKLGRTLVELAQFMQGQESFDLIRDALEKLQEAVILDANCHEALWWIGNAHTTQGFQVPDPQQAAACFTKAAKVFKQAIERDPTNESYRKSLEVSLKGPELHEEIQKQMALQGGGPPQIAAPPDSKAGKSKKSVEFMYDVAGWAILTIAVGAWLAILSVKAQQAQPSSTL